ncbi:MAG: sulfatase, partial [Planctomycetes bacterium]|nr:sulfatase [Planctomycetota bacterium]
MNVLLITSDQQRPDTIGRVNPAIRTPNLDRLATEGILFDRAYTVNPVCTPSRVTMLTGHYPSRHGCFHVGTSLPENYAPTLPGQLREAGYFTALLGK